MPMVSKSGVSNASSSRMHSSIIGVAKPASSNASRPASAGGAFRAGGAAKPFTAPVSNRMAAEDRIRVHGNGQTYAATNYTCETAAVPSSPAMPAAGARPRTRPSPSA